MDFLNMWPWAPNGRFSATDEAALAGTEAAAPYWPSDAYAYTAAACGYDVGDEVFGGDAYAFVGGSLQTQQQLRSSIDHQLATVTEGDPVASTGPGVAELAQSLYDGVAKLWRGLAANYDTDWTEQ